MCFIEPIEMPRELWEGMWVGWQYCAACRVLERAQNVSPGWSDALCPTSHSLVPASPSRELWREPELRFEAGTQSDGVRLEGSSAHLLYRRGSGASTPGQAVACQLVCWGVMCFAGKNKYGWWMIESRPQHTEGLVGSSILSVSWIF